MRILDLSLLFPGPFCSQILASFGAEVIKVERPGGGDWLRYVPPLDETSGEGLLFRAVNRGKRSLTLDLKSEEGRAILLRLAESADVLMESFRPGVMERLRLGYEELAAANPRLVYCSLTGYGAEGPYRGRAGHDLNYTGLVGLLDLTGPAEGPPCPVGAPLADITGGLWAAVGILLALSERERTGHGLRVEASLLGGALSALPLAVARGVEGLLGDSAVVFNVVDGVVRVALFVGYIWLIGRSKEIRRVFAYHGAEHKTIHAYEAGDPLGIEDIQRYSPRHPRCGTNFLLIVVLLALILFTALGRPSWPWLVTSRILGIPVIAGISYEILKVGADRRWLRWLAAPGMWLQALTTRQPEDDQVEVAVASLLASLTPEQRQDVDRRGPVVPAALEAEYT